MDHNARRRLLATSSSVSLLLLCAQTAYAEEAPASDQQASNSSPEIVVTAEKRESTIQRTPISVSAISGADLQRRGIPNLAEAAARIPGISSVNSGPGQAQYQIRGISSGASSGTAGTAATIGFYLDETALPTPALSTTGKSVVDPSLYDLSRVEVLRGPQGTLYGSGSMGGTIKLVTNSPNPKAYEGSAQVLLSGTDGGGFNYTGNAMVNAPIVEDQVALRIVGTYSHTSGWIDRIVLSDFPLPTNPTPPFFGGTRGDVEHASIARKYKNVNDVDLRGVRAALLLKPTERLTITPAVFYQRITADGPNSVDTEQMRLAHYQPFDLPESYTDRFTLFSLKAEYDLGFAALTSATAYSDRRSILSDDISEIVQNVLQLPEFGAENGLGAGAASSSDNARTRQFSQELRLSSNSDGPFTWILGAYLSNLKGDLLAMNVAAGLEPLLGTSTIGIFTQKNNIKQRALFANAKYAITDTLKLTTGLRYFRYTSQLESSTAGIFNATGLVPTVVSGSAKTDGFNPMVNLSYSRIPDFLGYVSAARGFREGGPNYPITTGGDVGAVCRQNLASLGITGTPDKYDPDNVWTYEIGEKARLFDRRLTLNASAYYTQWKKIQTAVVLPCGAAFVANGGDAEVKGVEIEMQLQVTGNLSIAQTVGYSDAKYTDPTLASGVQRGARLLQVPKWTLSTSVDYRYPVRDDGAVVAGITGTYSSSFVDAGYTLNLFPSRTIIGGRIGWDSDKFNAYLFVTNLTNEHTPLANNSSTFLNTPSLRRTAIPQSRTIGINVGTRF